MPSDTTKLVQNQVSQELKLNGSLGSQRGGKETVVGRDKRARSSVLMTEQHIRYTEVQRKV